VHARDLSDQRDDALLGRRGLYVGVLFALPVLGDYEERIRHPPHVAVAVPYFFDSHIVQVRPTVQEREVARVLDVQPGYPEDLSEGGPYRRLVDFQIYLLAVHGEERRRGRLAQKERIVDVE
jgi:hypothetical protein